MCKGGGGVDCVKYLKSGWNRKDRRGNKTFKKGGGQAGLRDGCLKKGEAGTPLQTIVHFWTYLLRHNSLSHQTWPIDRYKQGP